MNNPQPDVLVKRIKHYQYAPADQLGQGFSSKVFRGLNLQTNTPVAIKVIEASKLTNDLQRKLLGNQIKTLKKLDHPNLLKVHDVYQTPRNVYIVTEFYPDGDLAKFVHRKSSPLSESQILQSVQMIASGLLALQRSKIVHRDIKTANILIGKEGVLKIADFGFCEEVPQHGICCSYNVGSPLYMSPEACRRNQYSFKSDVWSLGVVMYEMFLRDQPFRGMSYDALIQSISSGEIYNQVTMSGFSKMLLSRMLLVDISRRLSPEEIINLINQHFTENSNRQGLIIAINPPLFDPKVVEVPSPTIPPRPVSRDQRVNLHTEFPSSRGLITFSSNTPLTRCPSAPRIHMSISNSHNNNQMHNNPVFLNRQNSQMNLNLVINPSQKELILNAEGSTLHNAFRQVQSPRHSNIPRSSITHIISPPKLSNKHERKLSLGRLVLELCQKLADRHDIQNPQTASRKCYLLARKHLELILTDLQKLANQELNNLLGSQIAEIKKAVDYLEITKLPLARCTVDEYAIFDNMFKNARARGAFAMDEATANFYTFWLKKLHSQLQLELNVQKKEVHDASGHHMRLFVEVGKYIQLLESDFRSDKENVQTRLSKRGVPIGISNRMNAFGVAPVRAK